MTKTELLKIAKPILFNTDMVRAILDGRKTVTRRVVNPQIETFGKAFAYKGALCSMDWVTEQSRYKIGDILYVRETWGNWCYDDNNSNAYGYYYKADYPNGARIYKHEQLDDCGEEIICDLPKWHPSIHMPKSAARILLKVTDVRVERLQDITAEQIDAEGCKEYGYNAETGKLMPSRPTWFKIIWNSTIKKQDLDKYGWNANPWVWVYEFERMECDEVN